MIEGNGLKKSICVQVGRRKQVGKTCKYDGYFFATQLFNEQTDYNKINCTNKCWEKS